MKSMDPEKQSADDGSGALVFTKKKTYQELEQENAQLEARVAELEAQLGISGGDAQPAADDEEQKDD